MIDRAHELPLTRQAELLRLGRSSLYYEPRPVPASELAIMRRLDALHLALVQTAESGIVRAIR